MVNWVQENIFLQLCYILDVFHHLNGEACMHSGAYVNLNYSHPFDPAGHVLAYDHHAMLYVFDHTLPNFFFDHIALMIAHYELAAVVQHSSSCQPKIVQ
jgi:hypothetical protein